MFDCIPIHSRVYWKWLRCQDVERANPITTIINSSTIWWMWIAPINPVMSKICALQMSMCLEKIMSQLHTFIGVYFLKAVSVSKLRGFSIRRLPTYYRSLCVRRGFLQGVRSTDDEFDFQSVFRRKPETLEVNCFDIFIFKKGKNILHQFIIWRRRYCANICFICFLLSKDEMYVCKISHFLNIEGWRRFY